MHASKRPRASPRLSDVSSSHTTSSTHEIQEQHQARDQGQVMPPMFKSSRTSDAHPHDRTLLCTLPPTCNPPLNTPTPIANSRDLEIHYGKYHAHVCEQRGCGCVFPDARLLELVRMSIWPRHRRRACFADVVIFADYRQHQTECHDPLAAVRKERGEKIVRVLPCRSVAIEALRPWDGRRSLLAI